MWSKAANGLTKSSWLLILTTPSPAPPHRQPLSQTIFDTFYPPNFCKAGLNDLKITETLLLYELYMMSRIMRRARILHLWHSSKKIWFWFFFFQVKCSSWRRRHSKNLMTFLVSQFSRILSQPYFEGSKMRFF